jgi:threonine dehydratase
MHYPTIADIHAAAKRIHGRAHRTPVLTCRTIDARLEASVFFKCENLQKAGAFKFRGACNAVFFLPGEDAARGVLTHSSGNHGAALALAARLRGIPATVVMPRNAPAVKRAAVEGYGARIVVCEPTLASRESTAATVLAESGATLVHPYDNETVIAGQGTAALELLEETPGLDLVLAPVGGGGLASGTAIAVRNTSPGTEVIAAEPAGADDAYRSLQAGYIIPQTNPQTIADGLRTSLCPRTFAAIRDHVREIVTVDEERIVEAMRLVWERMKILIEPSSAVPLAALLTGKVETKGRRIGIILSGGNVDLDHLPWMK